MRAQAVRAAGRLGARADLAAMLVDPAPVVVRHVAEALRDAPPPEDRLWEAYDALGERTARVLAWHLRTISKIDKVRE
ncbi:hypothetical protein [Microbispora sp. KK1-11]|uniref:hypothetical protein n=1 Tax=Microbispora sp. KK1-11 TaxID=2053005 RepID=UPI001156E86E|nr:hypothetical protein [Microbispora sp. KK1-11]TQS30549.1 hypothetical protein FLW16_04695 [Microbispora sp. KK1-11]